MVKSSIFQIRWLSKFKSILSRSHPETLIYASCLDYFNCLLIGISQASLSQLVQNGAALFLTGTNKRAHNLMVLNLSDLSELLHLYTPLCALRSANQMLLTVPKIFYKSRGDRAFAVLAPKMWIELLLEVRQVPSLVDFKTSWLLPSVSCYLSCTLALCMYLYHTQAHTIIS